MRKILVVATVGGVGYLIARAKLPKLHEQMMARCQQMSGRSATAGSGPCTGATASPCRPSPPAEDVHDAA